MLLIIEDKVMTATTNSNNRTPTAIIMVFQKNTLTKNKKMFMIELHQSIYPALLITYSTNENVLS